jgi:hypothetical protein
MRSGLWLLLVLLVFGLSIIGLRMDAAGFTVNMLAGLVGVVLSLALGVTVAERILRREKEARWRQTQSATLRAIGIHLSEIAGGVFLHFRLGAAMPFFQAHTNALDTRILEAFDPLIAGLRALPSSVEQGKSTSDTAVEYYEALRWDLDQIQAVLTPRLLESPTKQDLIDRLVDFDNARRELHHAIIAHRQAVTQSVIPKLITLIESAKRLYAEVAKQG